MIATVTRHATFIAAAAICFAQACSGGNGALSLSEYLERFREVGVRAQMREDKLTQPSPFFEAEEEDLEPRRAYLDANIASLKDSLEELRGLVPPDSAHDSHLTFIAAQEDLVRSYEEDLKARLSTVRSAFEFDRVSLEFQLSSTVEEIVNRADDACEDLQELADQNDVGIDLDCEL